MHNLNTMAMYSEMMGDCLLVRSVGDHDLDSGFVQMQAAMDKARAHYQSSGVRVLMLLDMLESEETRDVNEIRFINDFFRQFLDFLDGRIAILVNKQVHFGLSRVFGTLTESSGLDARPFYDRSAALAFLGL